MTILLDPTSEAAPAWRERAARPASLAGLTVGLVDISKPRGDVFLDRVESRRIDLGARVRRYTKPTFAKRAPADLLQQVAFDCGAVIEALAD